LHGACGFGRKRGARGFGRKRVFLQFLLHGACGFGRKRVFLQLLLSFGFLVLTSNTFWECWGGRVGHRRRQLARMPRRAPRG
jgi:hypothetical protein